MDTEAPLDPVEIPMAAVDAEILTAIIDNFILREGTDYGASEVSYDTRIEQVRRQIKDGKVRIFFDPNTETVTLLPK